MNTPRIPTQMVHFLVTKIPGTLESAQDNGHQAFQVVFLDGSDEDPRLSKDQVSSGTLTPLHLGCSLSMSNYNS